MTTSQAASIPTRLIAELRPNPLNARGDVNASGLDELAESIRAQGVLQPLLVTPSGVVVAGHRRSAAARIAGPQEVPVVIRDLDGVQQQEIMLVENLQQEDLSPVEKARAYRRMLDSGQPLRSWLGVLAYQRPASTRAWCFSVSMRRSSGCFTAAICRSRSHPYC